MHVPRSTVVPRNRHPDTGEAGEPACFTSEGTSLEAVAREGSVRDGSPTTGEFPATLPMQTGAVVPGRNKVRDIYLYDPQWTFLERSEASASSTSAQRTLHLEENPTQIDSFRMFARQ
jgi:hypothetical protein